jgi:hypothetical protein
LIGGYKMFRDDVMHQIEEAVNRRLEEKGLSTLDNLKALYGAGSDAAGAIKGAIQGVAGGAVKGAAVSAPYVAGAAKGVGAGLGYATSGAAKGFGLAKVAAGGSFLGGVGVSAAVVTAIILASRKLYQRHMTSAARACKGSEDKTNCIKREKIQALNAQKKYILTGRVKCQDGDCYTHLDNKIAQIESQIASLSK